MTTSENFWQPIMRYRRIMHQPQKRIHVNETKELFLFEIFKGGANRKIQCGTSQETTWTSADRARIVVQQIITERIAPLTIKG